MPLLATDLADRFWGAKQIARFTPREEVVLTRRHRPVCLDPPIAVDSRRQHPPLVLLERRQHPVDLRAQAVLGLPEQLALEPHAEPGCRKFPGHGSHQARSPFRVSMSTSRLSASIVRLFSGCHTSWASSATIRTVTRIGSARWGFSASMRKAPHAVLDRAAGEGGGGELVEGVVGGGDRAGKGPAGRTVLHVGLCRLLG